MSTTIRPVLTSPSGQSSSSIPSQQKENESPENRGKRIAQSILPPVGPPLRLPTTPQSLPITQMPIRTPPSPFSSNDGHAPIRAFPLPNYPQLSNSPLALRQISTFPAVSELSELTQSFPVQQRSAPHSSLELRHPRGGIRGTEIPARALPRSDFSTQAPSHQFLWPPVHQTGGHRPFGSLSPYGENRSSEAQFSRTPSSQSDRDPGPFQVPDSVDSGGLARLIREQNQRVPTPRTNPPLSELAVPENPDPAPIFLNALFDQDTEIEGVREEVKAFLRIRGWSEFEFLELSTAINSNIPGRTGRDKAYFVLAKQAALKGWADIRDQSIDILTPENRNILYAELERIHNNLVTSLDWMDKQQHL